MTEIDQELVHRVASEVSGTGRIAEPSSNATTTRVSRAAPPRKAFTSIRGYETSTRTPPLRTTP
jgi:hypothetical protein